MVKINLIGNIFGTSGYAVHTRNLFNALYEQNPDVHLETPLPQGWELMVSDQELIAINRPHYDDGVTIFIGLPPFWPAAKNQACKKFYGYCVWEGDKIPAGWLSYLIDANGILVPSEHVREAILETAIVETESLLISNRIHIIPHGVDTSVFFPQEKPERMPFTFVANKGWAQGMNDRGGLQFLFKAFAEEFRASEPVSLRVKINTAYCPPGWDLATEMNKLDLPADRPMIQISTDSLNDHKRMVEYYKGDVFVSPTMAEAFSIPCLEAMSCGLPVITSDFGGQTDFVNEENGWLVPTVPVEVTHDVMYEGVSWGKPDVNALRQLLRYTYDHPEEVKVKSKLARETALRYTWKESARKLLTVLQEEL